MTYLNAVLGEVDRMMGLISELLDVSRIETNRLQIDRQPIRGASSSTAAPTRSASRIRRARSASPPRCRRRRCSVDPDRMRQVVDNLISNAIKYSAEGTRHRARHARSRRITC